MYKLRADEVSAGAISHAKSVLSSRLTLLTSAVGVSIRFIPFTFAIESRRDEIRTAFVPRSILLKGANRYFNKQKKNSLAQFSRSKICM